MSKNKVQIDDDDMPPELDDFTDQIEKIKITNNINKNKEFIGDYSIPKEEKYEEKLPEPQLQSLKKEEKFLSGVKKGFFDSKPSQKSTITEVKINPNEKKKNNLEFEEVQTAMKMNNYLQEKKNEWLTPDLIMKISKNPNLQKLFSNQEYMQAISQMKTHPKETMERYGKNPEFMMLFQEFCKMMGGHFEQMGQKEKEEDQKKKQQEIDPVTKIIETDPQVKEILKDPKVIAFIEYLQKNQRVDLHQVMSRDPYLAPRLDVLIKKGVLNLQKY